MRVDWTLSDERVFHSASLIIVPGYNCTCEGPEDNHLFRAGLPAQVGWRRAATVAAEKRRRAGNEAPLSDCRSPQKCSLGEETKNLRKSLHLISSKTSKCSGAGSASRSG